MPTRLQIAVLVHMHVQAVLFGVGVLIVLSTRLSEMAMWLIPCAVIGSALVAAPLSWWIAPRLRARFWRDQGIQGDAISG